MRLHTFTRRSVRAACALAATACTLLVLAAAAGAVPMENVGPQSNASNAVPAPTIVRETVVQPAGGTDAIVFVLIGVGTLVAMLAAGYLGARMAVRATRARPVGPRPS